MLLLWFAEGFLVITVLMSLHAICDAPLIPLLDHTVINFSGAREEERVWETSAVGRGQQAITSEKNPNHI